MRLRAQTIHVNWRFRTRSRSTEAIGHVVLCIHTTNQRRETEEIQSVGIRL